MKKRFGISALFMLKKHTEQVSNPAISKKADYPDDIQLKTEIDNIANRIDRILETVRAHFPIGKNEQEKSEIESGEQAEEQSEKQPGSNIE